MIIYLPAYLLSMFYIYYFIKNIDLLLLIIYFITKFHCITYDEKGVLHTCHSHNISSSRALNGIIYYGCKLRAYIKICDRNTKKTVLKFSYCFPSNVEVD